MIQSCVLIDFVGSEAGSYLRLIVFVYHSTLGLRVIKKKRRDFVAEAVQTDQFRCKTEGIEAKMYIIAPMSA